MVEAGWRSVRNSANFWRICFFAVSVRDVRLVLCCFLVRCECQQRKRERRVNNRRRTPSNHSGLHKSLRWVNFINLTRSLFIFLELENIFWSFQITEISRYKLKQIYWWDQSMHGRSTYLLELSFCNFIFDIKSVITSLKYVTCNKKNCNCSP